MPAGAKKRTYLGCLEDTKKAIVSQEKATTLSAWQHGIDA
jgi:hypothetical protein